MGKYLPHRVGLPDAILLGRNEHLIEIAGNLPQRQPASPVLSHHSDRGLPGAVLPELVVEVVEAEGQVTSPLVPVPRSASALAGVYAPAMVAGHS